MAEQHIPWDLVAGQESAQARFGEYLDQTSQYCLLPLALFWG